MKIKRAKKLTDHLCNSCVMHFAECMPEVIEFGKGIGNDNVFGCSDYNKTDKKK